MTTCTEEGCDKPHFAHGRCIGHHFRVKRGSTRSGPVLPYRARPPRFCTIPGCKTKHFAKDLCAAHYRRLKKYGTLGGPVRVHDKNRPCSEPGCTNLYAVGGMCRKHYNVAYRRTHGGIAGDRTGE